MSQAVKNIEDYLANHLGGKQDESAKTLEYSFRQAAARFKSLDPQNCLTCGEPEVQSTYGQSINGVLVKHGGPIIEAFKERTMGDGTLHQRSSKILLQNCK